MIPIFQETLVRKGCIEPLGKGDSRLDLVESDLLAVHGIPMAHNL